jgi:hypothetical protein
MKEKKKRGHSPKKGCLVNWTRKSFPECPWWPDLCTNGKVAYWSWFLISALGLHKELMPFISTSISQSHIDWIFHPKSWNFGWKYSNMFLNYLIPTMSTKGRLQVLSSCKIVVGIRILIFNWNEEWNVKLWFKLKTSALILY